MLSDSEAILGASQAALPVALERIGQFGHEAALLTSFGTVGRPAVHIEARLVELLGEFGAGVAPDGDGQLSSVWRRLIADLHAFLGRLTMALAPYSLVRTYAGDRCIGVSAIHGPGRLATVRSAESGAVAARHARAVSVVLASQTTLVRTFAVAVRGAAIVTTALTMPLGALLALPAAWHLIQAVQTEARMRKRPLD